MKPAFAFSLCALAASVSARADDLGPPSPMPPRLLRALAHDPAGYDPGRTRIATDLLLGDVLFHSPDVLGERARALGLSCQSCHPNGATHSHFYLTGVSDRPGNVDLSTPHFRAGADDGIANALRIPSLRGARYTGPYGHDGRTASLAEFIEGVVTGEFGGAPLSPARRRALVHYVQDFDFLPNRHLDRTGHLLPSAGAAALRGYALFSAPREGLSGLSCASCHDPNTFYRDGKTHRLGTGHPASPYSMDDGYETPTLLGTAETAPYFHDGRFATLREVVEWFNEQFRLKLTVGERADLTACLTVIGAVDQREDDRPLGRRLVETAAYLMLLVDGEAAGDRQVWRAALDRVREAIGGEKKVPSLAVRIAGVEARLASLRARSEAGTPLSQLRPDVEPLRREITRLAADWTGALGADHPEAKR